MAFALYSCIMFLLAILGTATALTDTNAEETSDRACMTDGVCSNSKHGGVHLQTKKTAIAEHKAPGWTILGDGGSCTTATNQQIPQISAGSKTLDECKADCISFTWCQAISFTPTGWCIVYIQNGETELLKKCDARRRRRVKVCDGEGPAGWFYYEGCGARGWGSECTGNVTQVEADSSAGTCHKLITIAPTAAPTTIAPTAAPTSSPTTPASPAECDTGTVPASKKECKQSADAQDGLKWDGARNWGDRLPGCLVTGDGEVNWNKNDDGKDQNPDQKRLCA